VVVAAVGFGPTGAHPPRRTGPDPIGPHRRARCAVLARRVLASDERSVCPSGRFELDVPPRNRAPTSAELEAGNTKDALEVQHGRRSVVHANGAEHRRPAMPGCYYAARSKCARPARQTATP
jgi:hypothetical protein